VQKGNKETPSLVEIGSPSTPLDEPNITLVEKAVRPRYMLKSQDIIGIDVDKYSCLTNSMNNTLNSMPCSNNDHVDRLDFLKNEKEETFMFEPIILTLKEPLPNDELSAMHETYASFVYTLTCCYNSHVMLIMDAYVYNKFCKSRSCFVLGQDNDLKKEHVGKGPIFTNHVDKVRIMKRQVMPRELQFKSSTYPNPTMDVAVFINLRAFQRCTNKENEIFRSSIKLKFQRINKQQI
jgi:hypothetical protein